MHPLLDPAEGMLDDLADDDRESRLFFRRSLRPEARKLVRAIGFALRRGRDPKKRHFRLKLGLARNQPKSRS